MIIAFHAQIIKTIKLKDVPKHALSGIRHINISRNVPQPICIEDESKGQLPL